MLTIKILIIRSITCLSRRLKEERARLQPVRVMRGPGRSIALWQPITKEERDRKWTRLTRLSSTKETQRELELLLRKELRAVLAPKVSRWRSSQQPHQVYPKLSQQLRCSTTPSQPGRRHRIQHQTGRASNEVWTRREPLQMLMMAESLEQSLATMTTALLWARRVTCEASRFTGTSNITPEPIM